MFEIVLYGLVAFFVIDIIYGVVKGLILRKKQKQLQNKLEEDLAKIFEQKEEHKGE